MDTYTIAAAGLPALGWALHGGMLWRRLATARRDPLTGLHTRAGWTARAERLIAKQHPGALVLLVDLDDFKAINDTHGHAAGDAVLTATAQRLSNWCGHHGIAARLGGDEFAAIITNLGAANLFDLWSALDQPVTHNGHVIPVSASVGHCAPDHLPVPTLTDALSAADASMYAAKGHGRRNTH
ncbi:GGDEF domain-containing protein [Streptomyces sp. NPDC056222]|uniref:GGDEF domain-containing protein n=1 Tax=Streptomyces sp. NPDC056222 TaxID=3345749 RepID=UPI0035E14445